MKFLIVIKLVLLSNLTFAHSVGARFSLEMEIDAAVDSENYGECEGLRDRQTILRADRILYGKANEICRREGKRIYEFEQEIK